MFKNRICLIKTKIKGGHASNESKKSSLSAPLHQINVFAVIINSQKSSLRSREFCIRYVMLLRTHQKYIHNNMHS